MQKERREEKSAIGREGGRDGQMEEWDPRDVSFITPPCSLHSLSLSLQVFFSSSSSSFSQSDIFCLYLFPFIQPFIISYPDPSIVGRPLHNFHSFAINFIIICHSFLPAIFCSPSPCLSVWQSFLGFIISSGNTPPFCSPFFLPFSLSFSLTAFSLYSFLLLVTPLPTFPPISRPCCFWFLYG